MTLEELNTAIERDIQLHELFEMVYVVDGWDVNYTPDDGNTVQTFHGETPVAALTACFSKVRNWRGRS
jgi:uncharacterized cupin superfamily protein